MQQELRAGRIDDRTGSHDVVQVRVAGDDTRDPHAHVAGQGQDLPGFRLLPEKAHAFAPMLRRSSETMQYVVRTPTGQIIAQSDDQFSVGECVEVVPHADAPGPAFRYGQAQIIKSEKCTT